MLTAPLVQAQHIEATFHNVNSGISAF